MLTPRDIENPGRRSGYDHVRHAGDSRRLPWQAQAYGARDNHRNGFQWRGPYRSTPEEAAQDYCDHINGQKSLTPADLADPTTKSGYKHVRMVGGQPSRGSSAPYYQAQDMPSGGKRLHGPGRRTAEEAAQDYCDWFNGQAVSPATFALKSAGHPSARNRRARTAQQQVALDILRDARADDDDPGVVYLVIEEGDWSQAKIGWTLQDPPEARLGDYQAGNPRKLVMLAYFTGTKKDENALHRRFADSNVLGEWFRLTDEVLSEFDIQEGSAA